MKPFSWHIKLEANTDRELQNSLTKQNHLYLFSVQNTFRLKCFSKVLSTL